MLAILIDRRNTLMNDKKKFTGKNHIILLGSAHGTVQLIEQMLTDENRNKRDIIIAADLEKSPLPDSEDVVLIKGSPESEDTLDRANLQYADRVIIHTDKDETSLSALINTLKIKKESCEVTVECLLSDSFENFTNISGDFEVIMQMTSEMIVQAVQDKVHIPFQILMENNKAEEIYFITIPDSTDSAQKNKQNWQWWDVHLYLKKKYDYLTFALKNLEGKVTVNPPKETVISKGCSIWLLADKRPVNIDWKNALEK